MAADRDLAFREPRWSVNELQAALDEHAIVAVTDPGGGIRHVNDSFCELSKYSRQELIGANPRILNSGRHPKSFFSDLWECISSGHTWKGEIMNVAKDGTPFWIAATIVPHFDEQGHIRQYVAISNDITAKKKVEERLASLQVQSRQLAESIPQMNWTCDIEGHCEYLSPQWLEFTGVPEATQLGLGWLNRVHPDDRGKILHKWHLAASTDGSFEAEFRIRRFDGEYRWFRTRISPQKDDDGRVTRWFGICIDINDLRESQAKLVQAHAEGERHLAQLQAVLDNISEGVVAADLRGNVFHWNRAAIESHGFSDLSECQRRLPDFSEIFELQTLEGETLHLDDWPLARIFRGETIRGLTLRLLRIGSDWQRIFNYGGALARDPSGKPFLAVLSMADVTERQIAEESLQRMNDTLEERVNLRTRQLENANKELEAFSYSVSHDLRSPLRAMDGFSQAVIDDFGHMLPEEGVRYLNIVRQGAQRMGALIDDLLSFSQLGRAPLHKQEVDVEKLVLNALDDLKTEMQGRKVDTRIGPLPSCQGDPALLRQVWANLLSNALKYSRGRNPAVIEVGTTCAPGTCPVYYVRDNGAGFDMRYANKLFGVFQRLHRQEEYEGTGVGLAIVQRIIHRHGGKVWAEAELDKGAAFFFTVEEPGL